jgi:hypothetical protein
VQAFGVVPTSRSGRLSRRPGRPSLQVARAHPRYFVEPPDPTSHFAHREPKTGSLHILAASRILFKSHVRPLPVEDDSPQYLLTPSKNALPTSTVSRLPTSSTIIAAAHYPSRSFTPRYTMNWSATAVGSSGVEIKPLSQEEAIARHSGSLQ